ncbi:MAG: ferredoxin, partial [Clostridia bacterium]|nr:ferredoxin [Clostridia bacterium]
EVLKKIEDGDLYYTDFVELNACVSGCVGGVLNIENPFVARARIRGLRRASEAQCNDLTTENITNVEEYFSWERVPEVKDVDKLSENRLLALEKMEAIEALFAKLPHIDCGSCGAPSCRAFAIDVVNGEASIDSCPRIIKEENDG